MHYILILLLILPNHYLYSRELDCYEMIAYYSIDVNIKTKEGWKRVCDNNKIQLYVSENIPVLDADTCKQLCGCLLKNKVIKKHTERGL